MIIPLGLLRQTSTRLPGKPKSVKNHHIGFFALIHAHLKLTDASNLNEDEVIEEMDRQRDMLKEAIFKLETQQNLLRLIIQVIEEYSIIEPLIKCLIYRQKMEIKTEADDFDDGVTTREDRVLARWTSPRLNKRYMSYNRYSKES